MDPITWASFTLVSVIALTGPARRAMAGAWMKLGSIARRRIVSPSIVFIIAMLVGSIPILLAHAPIPSIHDEFGNLLIADTFAHGRLTNPTPVFWEHFETVHEIMRPTYAAKFPPGLGIMLALGKMIGSAALGAVMSVALACAFVTVALRDCWLPPRWALVGGLLAATHTLIYWWGQSYWGGGVAMLGGAVLLAGAGRAMHRPDVVAGIEFGAGLAVLALSRPLEGLIVAAILAGAVVWPTIRRHRLRILFSRVMPAMLAVLLPASPWMGYYNSRVTGAWTRLPWVEYARQAMTTPVFTWQPLPPQPSFRHEKLRQFHAEDERGEYETSMRAGYQSRLWDIAQDVFALWLNQRDRKAEPESGPRPMSLAVLAVALALMSRSRGTRCAAWFGVFVFGALTLIHPAVTPWMRAQYMAPAAAAFFLALTVALRSVATRWRRVGAALVVGFAAAQVAGLCTMITQIVTNDAPPGSLRASYVRQLEAEPGRQLVLVRYGPGRQQVTEWVYNDADIEASKVVFARSIDPASDRALLDHFRSRKLWYLDVNDRSVTLTPAP